MAGVDWTESTMNAAGTKLHVARAGRGRPILQDCKLGLEDSLGVLDDGGLSDRRVLDKH